MSITTPEEHIPPAGPLDPVLDHPALAGTGSIFGGQLGDCPNCEGGLPFNLKVDVSKRLLQLGVSRRAAAVRVVVHTGDGVWRSLDETPLPAPELGGPRREGGFEASSSLL